MANEFKPGDLVQFISGSANMTVEQIEGDTAYLVYWSEKESGFARITVKTVALKKSEELKGGNFN